MSQDGRRRWGVDTEAQLAKDTQCSKESRAQADRIIKSRHTDVSCQKYLIFNQKLCKSKSWQTLSQKRMVSKAVQRLSPKQRTHRMPETGSDVPKLLSEKTTTLQYF